MQAEETQTIAARLRGMGREDGLGEIAAAEIERLSAEVKRLERAIADAAARNDARMIARRRNRSRNGY
jgi:hypothetical protein